MPHQFKAHPEHPALAYLVRLHADIGGRIKDNKAAAEKLAADMLHVEAVLKMFDPEFNCRKIAPRRRRAQGNPWFKRGTLFRHAIDALRISGAPMTVKEIADAVIAAKDITDATDQQRRDLEGSLRSSLEFNAGKTVRRVDGGVPRRWTLL